MDDRFTRAGRTALAVVALVIGVAGIVVLGLGIYGHVRYLTAPTPTPPDVAGARSTAPAINPLETPALDKVEGDRGETAEPAAPPAPKPITRLLLPRTGIETNVVPAPFVLMNEDEGTWEVPPFVAGHAEFTAGAGQLGNAVLLGHVTSISLGNVFEHLDRVRPGDLMYVASEDEEYTYQVTEVLTVSRTDVSVLQPWDAPGISLITCTGAWLPQIRDYAQRLVVRGELAA
jgi:LPXTG-site transpeptidase (sortase) family protein